MLVLPLLCDVAYTISSLYVIHILTGHLSDALDALTNQLTLQVQCKLPTLFYFFQLCQANVVQLSLGGKFISSK